MQYHIQTLVKHLFDKDSFEQVTVQELKQFTEDYPFAAVGQYLYAKKLKDSGSYNYYEQCEQASLYFHNALWLRWQLDQKEEVPALPVKAEETAQQPGFRIVVQMPKTAPAAFSTKPAIQPEEKKEEEAIQSPAASLEDTSQPTEQTAPEATASAVPEEAVTEEQGNSLQVNEDGSLVEKEAVDAPQQEATKPADTASAVAIAESSQLAEEIIPTDVPLNAVSITEEVLTPAAGATENTNSETNSEALAIEDRDDIVPAVEVTEEMVEEIDDIVPAVEVPVEATASEAVTAEQQAVEPVIESIAAAAGPAFTAETEVPATEEPVVDNTKDIPAETRTEEPALAEPEFIQAPPSQQAQPSQHSMEGKGAVDLGEPIFESYHTIDYFASQGVKLMQDDFKDRLGKQLKSFTDWLRSMKRVGPVETTSIDEVTNKNIQRIAEHSVEEKEVLTEAMAEVWAKQGNAGKAIQVYEKLSLLNPAKSTYFANRIEQLKAL